MFDSDGIDDPMVQVKPNLKWIAIIYSGIYYLFIIKKHVYPEN